MTHYITRRGAKALSQELNQLLSVERPRIVHEVAEAAAQGDRSENAEYIYGKKRLREIDRRIRFLTQRLDNLSVVSPKQVPDEKDRVFFGAFVTVEDEDGKQKRYQLVGPDEIAPDDGRVSYLSPLGRALMKKRLGDVAVLQRPAGDVELEITAIDYDVE